MSQSLSKILLHAIFSTKNRTKSILPDFKPDLYGYIASICRTYKSNVFKIGGTKDHIHIAFTLPRTISVANLLEEIKKSTSKWIKTKNSKFKSFSWQAGYAVFSLGQSQLDILVKYIGNQKNHHKKKTFQEEVVEFLKKYDLEYDEQFLWD